MDIMERSKILLEISRTKGNSEEVKTIIFIK